MASLTQWTWVWASSRQWWRTGKPGVLQSMGSERVRDDWVSEQYILSVQCTWTILFFNSSLSSSFSLLPLRFISWFYPIHPFSKLLPLEGQVPQPVLCGWEKMTSGPHSVIWSWKRQHLSNIQLLRTEVLQALGNKFFCCLPKGFFTLQDLMNSVLTFLNVSECLSLPCYSHTSRSPAFWCFGDILLSPLSALSDYLVCAPSVVAKIKWHFSCLCICYTFSLSYSKTEAVFLKPLLTKF